MARVRSGLQWRMSSTSPIRNTKSRSAEREQLRDRIDVLMGRITNAQAGTNPNNIPILHPRIFGLKAEIKPNQIPATQSPIRKARPNPTVPVQVLIELRNRIMVLLGQSQSTCPESIAKSCTEQQKKMLARIAELRLQVDAQKRLKLRFQRKARSLARANDASVKSFQVEAPTENILPEATADAALSEGSPMEEKFLTSFQALGIDPMDVETKQWANQMEKWEREVNSCRYSLSDEDEVIW
jgi:hypothetical protein